MALGPREMKEAILKNLPAKTGKTETEWLALIQQSGLTEKKEIITFLKDQHNLGHFQAQTIYEQFIKEATYENTDVLLSNLFSSPQQYELYTLIRSKISSLGTDVREEPCKTYSPFYRTKQFAALQPSGNKAMLLALNLPQKSEHKLLTNKGTFSTRLNQTFLLNSITCLDHRLESLLQLAYKNN